MDTETLTVTVDAYATGYSIPPSLTGQPRTVHIGSCTYGRYPGIYAYIVFGQLEAYGLKRDGTWDKYGDDFGTAQAALDRLLDPTTRRPWAHRT